MTKSTKSQKNTSRRRAPKLQTSTLHKTRKQSCGRLAYKPFENPTFERKYRLGSTKENNAFEKNLVKVFKTALAPSRVTPQNDYYYWINYEWIDKQRKESEKSVKKYYVQIDSFRVTQEKVYYELIDIIQNYIRDNKTKRATEVKNLFESLIRLDNNVADRHLKECMMDVERLIEQGNLYKMLAYLNQNELVNWGSPIVWTLQPDEKNTNIYRSLISAPQLTAYDYMLYLEDEKEDARGETYKKKFKQEFIKYVSRLFKAAGMDDHVKRANDVWKVEYEILSALGCDSIKNDNEDGYNVVKASECVDKYGFDWKQFATELGYKTVPDKFICTSLNYLKCIMTVLNEKWQQPEWRSYFHYIIIRQISLFGRRFRDIHYEFKGKFIEARGEIPIEIEALLGMSLCFNTLLTNEYIKRHNREEEIEFVKNLSSDLRQVFIRILKRNTWLSPSTKRAALKKIEHLEFVIGSPKLLREDPLLDYSSDDPWDNMLKITRWKTKKQIELEGAETIDIPVVDWNALKLVGTQAYIVNAFYTPIKNSIYFPLAYLQKPFVDLDERGIEYNLAYVGYTIGHEMSHALDDTGSKYDYKGRLHSWWTPHDRKVFEQKIKDVAKQYETFAAYDGVKMDAMLSMGENLADISGLAICEEYLRDFQVKNDDIRPIRNNSFRAFYIYIAVQARQHIYKNAIRAQLKINPHPMDKYRTNCPLARLPLFTSTFNIKEGDKMYWPNQDTIW